MDIDLVWTPSGLAATDRAELRPFQVIDIAYSPTAIVLTTDSRASLWFVDYLAEEEAYYTVLCDQQARNTSIYEITNVRASGDDEITMWRSKNS